MPGGSRTARCSFAVFACVAGLFAPTAARAYTLRYTHSGDPVRWSTAQVRMRVDAGLCATSDESMQAAQLGFAAWAGIAGVPELVLDRATSLPPGYSSGGSNENGIYRVASLPVSGAALAVTVTTYRDDGWMLDADVLVLDSRDLQLISADPRGGERRMYDLASVLAHESGHVLGLGEATEDDAATMWPRLHVGDTTQRSIEDDDRAGVQDLYADVDFNLGVGARRGSCGVQGPLGRGGVGASALFALGLAALAALVRHRERRRALVGAALLALVAGLCLSQPLASADDGVRGRARLLDVRWEGGLLVTEYDVATTRGHERLVVAGGARDGIVQQVGEALPPADGAEVWLGVVNVDGVRAWANLDEVTAAGGLRTPSGLLPASAR